MSNCLKAQCKFQSMAAHKTIKMKCIEAKKLTILLFSMFILGSFVTILFIIR